MLIEMGDTRLGRNILFLRKKYYLSRKALACLVGISVHSLKDWEVEKSKPIIRYDQLKRIAAIFNLSVEALVNEEIIEIATSLRSSQ